jgi:hypothetical protein
MLESEVHGYGCNEGWRMDYGYRYPTIWDHSNEVYECTHVSRRWIAIESVKALILEKRELAMLLEPDGKLLVPLKDGPQACQPAYAYHRHLDVHNI